MQHFEFFEEAIRLVTTGLVTDRTDERSPVAAANELWVLSKCRIRKWQESALPLESGLRGPHEYHPGLWLDNTPLISELLASHIFTATWSAYQCHHNRKLWDDNPAIETVFTDSRDVRNRMSRIIEIGYQQNAKRRSRIEQIDALRMLHRMSEQWIDLLLGFIPNTDDDHQFGFDSALIERNTKEISRLKTENPDAILTLGQRVRKDGHRLFQKINPSTTSHEAMNEDIHKAMVATIAPVATPTFS